MNSCRVYHCRFKNTHITSGHKCGKCGMFGHGQVECGNILLIKTLQDNSVNDYLNINLHCKSPGCIYKYNHTTKSHICELCAKYHSKLECPLFKPKKLYTIECPICRKINNVSDKEPKIFGLTEKCKICLENEVNYLLPDCKHCSMCHECSKKLMKKKIITHHDTLMQQAEIKMDTTPGKIYVKVMAGMGCMYFYKRDDINHNLISFFMHSDEWGQYGPSTDRTNELNQFLSGYSEII